MGSSLTNEVKHVLSTRISFRWGDKFSSNMKRNSQVDTTWFALTMHRLPMTKVVNRRFAKRPSVFNGLLADRRFTSLVKEATVVDIDQ